MQQLDLLQYAADVLERLNTPYLVVGSYGSFAYGEPRFTHDIDFVVDLNLSSASAFCAAFPLSDFFVSEDAVREAIRTRFQFVVLENRSGHKIDFIFPRDDPWGRSQFERREQISLVSGRLVDAASREDIILGKMLYYAEGRSPKHLRDIKGILATSGDLVNRKEIELWARDLNLTDIWTMILTLPDDVR